MNVASRAAEVKRDWLDWPFFGESHRALAGALDRFVASGALAAIDHDDVDVSCRKLARDPCPAHLRRRDRGAEAHCRARASQGETVVTVTGIRSEPPC